MLNWDDEIQLSQLEVEQARQIAIAPLDDAIADADRLLSAVMRLHACPERDQLIERAQALREERLSIKQARLAQLDLTLPENKRVVSVRADDLKAEFSRYDDYRVVRRNGQVVSFDPSRVAVCLLQPLSGARAVRRTGRLVFSRRRGRQIARAHGLEFVVSMLRRNAANRLRGVCEGPVRLPRARRR
ncbi:hypothetical protein [Paraburkholderia sp. GAS334]|uniref:hypothetical protein n=1 Tax=Paraburkholderia sp. GAS334 TaxID=3035131 RepID=UPI003D1FBCEA